MTEFPFTGQLAPQLQRWPAMARNETWF